MYRLHCPRLIPSQHISPFTPAAVPLPCLPRQPPHSAVRVLPLRAAPGPSALLHPGLRPDHPAPHHPLSGTKPLPALQPALPRHPGPAQTQVGVPTDPPRAPQCLSLSSSWSQPNMRFLCTRADLHRAGIDVCPTECTNAMQTCMQMHVRAQTDRQTDTQTYTHTHTHTHASSRLDTHHIHSHLSGK